MTEHGPTIGYGSATSYVSACADNRLPMASRGTAWFRPTAPRRLPRWPREEDRVAQLQGIGEGERRHAALTYDTFDARE